MTRLFHLPRGFTLIELTVTVAILAILTVLAAPSFVDYQRNIGLTMTANRMASTLATARSEAIRQNSKVRVEPRENKAWATGWLVYADLDGNGSFNPDNDSMLLTTDALPSYIEARMTRNNVQYDGSGFTSDNGSMQIRRTDGNCQSQSIRLVIISPTGRVRVCRPGALDEKDCTSPLINKSDGSESDCKG